MKFRRFVNCVAYIGIVLLAVALILSAIPNKIGTMCQVLVYIAMAVEVVVGVVYAYLYARSKEQLWITIMFGIAVVAIIAMVIIKYVWIK